MDKEAEHQVPSLVLEIVVDPGDNCRSNIYRHLLAQGLYREAWEI